MNFEERALILPCNNSWMYGILSLPDPAVFSRGVLIVVGGPQYRVGSHRQFTSLAWHLAAHGVPVLRFDCRGMGDSEGDIRTFEDMEDDLRSAIDGFFEEVPSLSELAIWGLCDAASAALLYAYRDRRVTGLVLLNPWVRTDEGSAKVYLKYYYTSRLFQPEFWSKIRHGNFNYAKAARSFSKIIGRSLAGKNKTATTAEGTGRDELGNPTPLPNRMFHGLSRFQGKILLVISGNDLTAREFSDMIKNSREWQKLLASPRVTHLNLPEANHTFSRREWRDLVAAKTTDWIYSR